uniref:Sperm-associated antigen 8 n=1 Tax=Mesocestoides corti TaxID=53468 RepID=A0A5K3EU09_MESCO
MSYDSYRQLLNSQSKCLLENWFEERQTKAIDKGWEVRTGRTHPGLVTTQSNPIGLYGTTYKSHFAPKPKDKETIGARTKDMMEAIRRDVAKEIRNIKTAKEDPTDYRSTAMVDYFSNPAPPHSSVNCQPISDLHLEEPVSFWTDNYSSVTGISQRTTGVKPFHKSFGFSKSMTGKIALLQHQGLEGYISRPTPKIHRDHISCNFDHSGKSGK